MTADDLIPLTEFVDILRDATDKARERYGYLDPEKVDEFTRQTFENTLATADESDREILAKAIQQLEKEYDL